jgi:hypothetical protein
MRGEALSALGLPLMVAIIGGEPRPFRPLVDLYREAGLRAGHSADRLTVGVHALPFFARRRKRRNADSNTRLEARRRCETIAGHNACHQRAQVLSTSLASVPKLRWLSSVKCPVFGRIR